MMLKSGHSGTFNNLWLKPGWMLSANVNVPVGLSYQQNGIQRKTRLLLTRVLLRSAFSSEISSSLSNSCSRHALSSLVNVANSCKTAINSTTKLGFDRFCLKKHNATKNGNCTPILPRLPKMIIKYFNYRNWIFVTHLIMNYKTSWIECIVVLQQTKSSTFVYSDTYQQVFILHKAFKHSKVTFIILV